MSAHIIARQIFLPKIITSVYSMNDNSLKYIVEL
jgi:hypothetical protein